MLTKLLNTFKKQEEHCCSDPLNRDLGTLSHPMVRTRLAHISVKEDQQNPYYRNLLDTIANDSIGTFPTIISHEEDDLHEDRWIEWGVENGIGSFLRLLRRDAAKTGLGVGVPYVAKSSRHPTRLSFKNYNMTDLVSPAKDKVKIIKWEFSPTGAQRTTTVTVNRKRIYEGIEYDENCDIKRLFIRNSEKDDVVGYDVSDILVWSKNTDNSLVPIPECGPAFNVYPGIRRFLEAIIKGEEFAASIPMFMKLTDMWPKAGNQPKGHYKVTPNAIPTLPPGVEIQNGPSSQKSSDRTAMMRLMVSAAARCVSMPSNLAFGDSSDHNMSSSMTDRQMWVNWVKIDRHDFERVSRKTHSIWFEFARNIPGYFASDVAPSFSFGYTTLFQHPDPAKCALANDIGFANGSLSLDAHFASKGQNGRRAIQAAANLIGMSYDEYIQHIFASRGKPNLELLQVVSDGN